MSSEDNNDGRCDCEDWTGRHERLLEDRRQRTVAGGEARHAPRTGAGGDEGVGRVQTRCSTVEEPESRSGTESESSACFTTRTIARPTL